MLRIFSTHGLFGFLLIGLMITSCGGNTSSNTPSTGTSSKTSDGGGTGTTPVTSVQSNTTPQPQRNDYTSQCNAKDLACISTQSSKWSQDLAQWRTNGGSGGTTGTNPIIPFSRQNAQDTYADCVRSGYPNCDLDLRGVP